jgi:CheY-like chemotaxis protein
MDTIPYFSAKTLQFLARRQSKHTDATNLPLQQLLGWVDEQQAIFEIGVAHRRDPLLIARELLPAFQQGWLVAGREQNTTTDRLPTILVVDDSDLMRQLIQRVLRDRYRVIVAGTAMEALGLLDREPVELMLLDVSMPGIDGLELCRSVRNMSRFRDLPIVMVTARDGFFDKVKGRMAGATEYLTKPFENEQLIDLVGEYVQPVPSKMV